jgi:sugar O-acyltransferase (sialic acid O-acetyltransferase NeuD family)
MTRSEPAGTSQQTEVQAGEMLETDRRIVLIGNGGHARVLRDTLALHGLKLAAVAVSDESVPTPAGVPRISDAILLRWDPAKSILLNGVGSVDVVSRRRSLYQKFVDAGFEFLTVRHPAAIVAADAQIGSGAQIMAGAIVQPGARIGDNVLLNTRSVIEHDCEVGSHTHVATGAILAGGVRVGVDCLIGAGSVVRQGIRIGDGALLAAGAVVVHDVAAGARVAGVVARPMRSKA